MPEYCQGLEKLDASFHYVSKSVTLRTEQQNTTDTKQNVKTTSQSALDLKDIQFEMSEMGFMGQTSWY